MDYIGIDVREKENQICVLTEGGERLERRVRTVRRRLRFYEAGTQRAAGGVARSCTSRSWVNERG
jgi:hypothetical protein